MCRTRSSPCPSSSASATTRSGKIVGKVQAKVNDEITRRNDFAHGDWWFAFGGLNMSMALGRYKPSRRLAGSLDVYSPEALDAAAKDVRELTGWVVDVGGVCLDKVDSRKLGDYFAIEEKQLVRLPVSGPRSGMFSE